MHLTSHYKPSKSESHILQLQVVADYSGFAWLLFPTVRARAPFGKFGKFGEFGGYSCCLLGVPETT